MQNGTSKQFRVPFWKKSIRVYLINSLCLSKKQEAGRPRATDGKLLSDETYKVALK